MNQIGPEEFELCRQYRTFITGSAARHQWRPELIAGILSRESRFGLLLDEDGKGDRGHGHGLMQIDDRSFGSWLAANDWRDPQINIEKGVQILTDKYNILNDLGIFGELSDSEAERAALAAYNCGEGNESKALAQDDGAPGLADDFDERTTGRDYSEDVLERAEAFKEIFQEG